MASDLPLTFAFFFSDSADAADKAAWTSMGPANVAESATWRAPPAGNFTLTAMAIDTFGASAYAQRQVGIQAVGATARMWHCAPRTWHHAGLMWHRALH